MLLNSINSPNKCPHLHLQHRPFQTKHSLHFSLIHAQIHKQPRANNQGPTKIHPNTFRAITESSLWIYLQSVSLCSALSSAFSHLYPKIRHTTPAAMEVSTIRTIQQSQFAMPKQSRSRICVWLVLFSCGYANLASFVNAFSVSPLQPPPPTGQRQDCLRRIRPPFSSAEFPRFFNRPKDLFGWKR